jgi:hypothetical protein
VKWAQEKIDYRCADGKTTINDAAGLQPGIEVNSQLK